MLIGLFNVNAGAASYPEGAARVARLAEEAGYDSLWAGEHVVLPDPRVPPSPMEPQDRILDPAVALAFLAAQTRAMRLCTGIVILPQRNPLVLAKELASLDVVCGGRLTFGVGVGYLEPEFRAIGVPFEDRGARTMEYLDAMQALWSQPRPAYAGRFVAFEGVDAHPRPVQQPVPVVMGGHAPPAYRRAVERGHGWYGFGLNEEKTAEHLEGLRRAAARYERPAELGELEISVTPRRAPDADGVRRYADLGVHRLVLLPPPGLDLAGLEAFVTEHAPA